MLELQETAEKLIIHGYSDDLIEWSGAVEGETTANWSNGSDAPTKLVVRVKTLAGIADVSLTIIYDEEGIWRISGTAGQEDLVEIIRATEIDDGKVDADGCPDYSDKAIIRGGYEVSVLREPAKVEFL